jgi:hypothetical protein
MANRDFPSTDGEGSPGAKRPAASLIPPFQVSTSVSLRDANSSPPEIRRALLVEGQHAFAAILGWNHPVVGLDLECEPVPQR